MDLEGGVQSLIPRALARCQNKAAIIVPFPPRIGTAEISRLPASIHPARYHFESPSLNLIEW